MGIVETNGKNINNFGKPVFEATTFRATYKFVLSKLMEVHESKSAETRLSFLATRQRMAQDETSTKGPYRASGQAMVISHGML
jgi:hypothetical protein